uniref:Sulfotransferase domain-containing protein n=2 Tax=Haptolina ericina TaxID=156174 RepID=A0A7S3EV21_9EUKA|mmetsp:Transcript_26731/g.60447  ORF Transcript_26731/g.60447 Transcript_26731/m.60447 type:complete len:151 (+) Transcript_26731:1000-1452(+)
MRSLAVSGVMDAAIPRTCLNKKVISTLSTSWWMKQGMIVSYEELQTDVVGAMTRVARFLGLAVSLPEMQRVYGKDVGVFKKSKEDLREVLSNFKEFEAALSPTGAFASTCFLQMLRETTPRVFEPCSLPLEWFATWKSPPLCVLGSYPVR